MCGIVVKTARRRDLLTAFVENPDEWAAVVFEANTLVDLRLSDRLIVYAGAQAVEPALSTSAACSGNAAAQEGAYRMIENPRVEAVDIEEGPFQYTAELVAQRKRVLAVQDTSSVSVRHQPLAEGLKNSGSPTGFLVHSNLMVDSDTGEPLGLIDQQRWTREKNRPDKAARRQIPYADRESFKWERSTRKMNGRLYSTDSVINVADRESDIFELLKFYSDEDLRFIIRARTDRRVDAETERLWTTLEAAPVLGTRSVTVAQRGGQVGDITQSSRASRKQRQAVTEIRSTTVFLQTPGGWRGEPLPDGLQVNAVMVTEPDAPEDVEPLEWLLLTGEPVETLEQAELVVRDYERRWLIEEFHKCWKTGCNLEERPLQTLDAVERMMVILAPIAVRIMQLQALANNSVEETPCEPILSQDQWHCLWQFADWEAAIPSEAPSAKWAYYTIARLGGFCDSKRTGRVGWRTMWRGWSRLQERVIGWRGARATLPAVLHLN